MQTMKQQSNRNNNTTTRQDKQPKKGERVSQTHALWSLTAVCCADAATLTNEVSDRVREELKEKDLTECTSERETKVEGRGGNAVCQ